MGWTCPSLIRKGRCSYHLIQVFYVVLNILAVHDAPTVKRDRTDFGGEIPLRDQTSMRHSFPYIGFGFGFACWRESLKDVWTNDLVEKNLKLVVSNIINSFIPIEMARQIKYPKQKRAAVDFHPRLLNLNPSINKSSALVINESFQTIYLFYRHN